jgi:hypothetical protein
MTVAEFLTARLDEAEETVHREVRFCEATGREVKDWGKYVYDPVIGPYGGQSRMRDAATGIYIAKVADPTRLLADIAAKKRILANYIEWQGNHLPTAARQTSGCSAHAPPTPQSSWI